MQEEAQKTMLLQHLLPMKRAVRLTQTEMIPKAHVSWSCTSPVPGEQYTVGVIDHGNTAIVAEMIADETGADLFKILPEDDHYPMTYAELTDVAKKEQNENARPAYAGEVPDLSQYDTVFIKSSHLPFPEVQF